MSLPAVPLTVTRSACAVADQSAERAGEVEVDLADAGAVEVVDRDGVGAAEGVEVDGLDACGVHRDVAGVAEEPEPASVGGDVDLFGRGGAVEDHRVVAVLALDDVAAVAGIPDERVVAGAHQGRVGTTVAVDRVVAAGADQHLRSGATGERVVPVATVERRRDRVREDAVRLVDAHRVVAITCVEVDAVDVLALEVERVLPCVSDVDLEHVGPIGLEAKHDGVVARPSLRSSARRASAWGARTSRAWEEQVGLRSPEARPGPARPRFRPHRRRRQTPSPATSCE